MKLGEKIRLLRTLRGYTQEVMADSLKLSITGYGKIERGETDATVSRICPIADILGVKVEDILRLDDTIALQNYEKLQPHSFGVGKRFPNHEEANVPLKTLYENRINRLEDELLEMRKLLFDLMSKIL